MGTNTGWRRPAAMLLATLAVGTLVTSCAASTNSSASNVGKSATSDGCSELLADARDYVRNGQTDDGRLGWTLDEMSYRCGSAYDAFIEGISGATDHGTPTGIAQTPTSGPVGAISWSEAIDHVGSTQYVCGPLVNSGTSSDDVFLNLGRGYPNVERFTIVLWDIGGIESLPEETMLCATGTITLHQGTAQIELRSTDAVEVWE